MENSEKAKSKLWLQRLKDESWEAELLVSAVAVFGTFKLFVIINWITNVFINILNPKLYSFAFLIVFFGLFGISILAAMFVIHFCLRAYWIGLVGLNSVFPDYSIEDSAYSKIYTEKIVSVLPKVKDSIEKVDELCSVIFSVAFTFLLIYTNTAIIFSIYLFVYNGLIDSVPSYLLLIPIYAFIAILIIQTVIGILANLKINHNKAKLQIIAFKTNKIASIIMFGPLNKSILQISMVFGSNFKKKKKLVYLLIVFLIFGSLVASYQMKNTNIDYMANNSRYFKKTIISPTFYKTNNENNDYLLNPEIDADIITKKLLKVFIPIFKYEHKTLAKLCGHDNKKLSKAESNEANRICYTEYLTVKVNENTISPDYLTVKHERTNQLGAVFYLKTEKFKGGKNIISISKKENPFWEFPFFLEK
ncbi:hypothetical protein BTO06_05905 [Tenacibaculum sp. SZ-18]|uniref:hypothetical protein n=1 Tax=Tenacibaculum sp. SZ-18 TaxID=754423 RepID=UPI000C2D3570|nr:hypothetical protein [Tenacibaculum sp. SZ-18]AUC14704.1 hypothetical protein BTO06_05905 [Tenacibaculum sp. SZ-18]